MPTLEQRLEEAVVVTVDEVKERVDEGEGGVRRETKLGSNAPATP